MYINDLVQSAIKFPFPKDIKENKVKLVLYNEKENIFHAISTLSSRTDYLRISLKSLDPHWQYKYMYQINKDKKWITAKPYKYINVRFQDENNVRYKFYRNENSKHLLIIFSGNGESPAYNYIGGLSELQTNKLFILDDFTTETFNNSVFYVGSNRKNDALSKVSNLIEKIINEIGISKSNIICGGTSKGGFASILYSLKYGYGHCVVGSPTIYLGNSLLGNNKMTNHAKVISGGTTDDDKIWMNNLIPNLIDTASECQINVIVGNKERRYFNDVLPFKDAVLKNNRIKLNIQEQDFEKHSMVGTLYPAFACEQINKLINE